MLHCVITYLHRHRYTKIIVFYIGKLGFLRALKLSTEVGTNISILRLILFKQSFAKELPILIWTLRLESSKNEAFEKALFLLNKTKLFAQAKALFY